MSLSLMLLASVGINVIHDSLKQLSNQLKSVFKLKPCSCININARSCLKPLSNQLKAIFKQIKTCSNHGIHVLFEDVLLENPQNGQWFVCMTLRGKTLRSEMPFCTSRLNARNTVLMTFRRFQYDFRLESGKNARITVTHMFVSLH